MVSGQQNDKDFAETIVQHVYFEVVEDTIEPPPPDCTSKFNTIQNWLLDICNRDKPSKPIAEYKIGLFESTVDFTLSLIGVNTYDESTNRSIIRIEFEPSNMYFKLPELYYENLNREQLLVKLTSNLKEFTNTEHFKSSFFTEAKAIIFEPNGQTVWSK